MGYYRETRSTAQCRCHQLASAVDAVGDRAAGHLRSVGIDPVYDLRGVGQNLMDHLEVYVQQTCVLPVSLHKHLEFAGTRENRCAMAALPIRAGGDESL